MRVEQVADLLGGRFRQARGFCLQLAQLFQRDRHGLRETVALGLDLAFGDAAFADRKIAALGDMSGADGDAGRDAEA